ncbi:MAG TPA: hypothetical protein VLW17_11880, partial [Thermoanaerobaculaceae bacterium]|nr:hypothetical protein [Thermoanaerobaculaceae bacterium]
MTSVRIGALAPPLLFAALAGVLAAVGAIAPAEALGASASVAAGFLASGWVAPAGWRRRAAETALLPVAWALTMLDDPSMRQMGVAALLVAANALACWAALGRAPRRAQPAVVAAFAVALALGPGAPAGGAAALALGMVGSAAMAWGATRAGGPAVGAGAVLLVAGLQLPTRPAAAFAMLAAGAALGLLAPRLGGLDRVARSWMPAAFALAVVGAALAPWGGLGVARAFPAAGWPALAAAGGAAALTPFLPPAAAGAAWLAATLALGPASPPPPDVAGFTLPATASGVALPQSRGGPYLLDIALDHAAALPPETPVAIATAGSDRLVLRAGINAAEWAWARPDVRATVAHPLPRRPVWRAAGSGRGAFFGVAGRTEVPLPAGVTPRIARAAGLPPEVGVVVATAGSARPTPPRDWALPAWLLGGAAVVALLQLAAGTWRRRGAAVPWALLAVGSLAARMPVEPLRVLAERHAVDLALAALLAAWVPAARLWLAGGRVFRTAAALLLPLALATPHLTPPLWGDEPYHLVMLDSLARFHTVDLSAHYPPAKPGSPLHSPALALLLFPAYLAAGRTGALVGLALAGAAAVALLSRRAGQLGIRRSAAAVMALLLLATYPLATFSTQIWVEIVGVMAVAASLVLADAGGRGRTAVAGMAAVATAVKTRLGLVAFPIAVAAWWGPRRGARRLATAAAALAATAAVGLGVTWLWYGRPLGTRTPADLLPAGWTLPALVVGGLVF